MFHLSADTIILGVFLIAAIAFILWARKQ